MNPPIRIKLPTARWTPKVNQNQRANNHGHKWTPRYVSKSHQLGLIDDKIINMTNKDLGQPDFWTAERNPTAKWTSEDYWTPKEND